MVAGRALAPAGVQSGGAPPGASAGNPYGGGQCGGHVWTDANARGRRSAWGGQGHPSQDGGHGGARTLLGLCAVSLGGSFLVGGVLLALVCVWPIEGGGAPGRGPGPGGPG